LAGTGLCSYRVRGVDGSCAKHSTVESYTVVMLLTFILIIISIPSPSHSHSRLKNLPFLQILRTVAFHVFFRTDYMYSPDCCVLTDTSEHIHFLLLIFLFSTF